MSDRVRRYYRDKTRALLEKYGPGPRVHFHVGFAEAAEADCDDPSVLRRRLFRSQQAVLDESGRAYDELLPGRGGRWLDVGCGLGGGALHWAETRAAQVVALTPVAEHARLVGAFAADTGLEGRVLPLVADAHALPGAGASFDVAVAVESSCYLQPRVWLASLARVLRPGGSLFVVDAFLAAPEVKAGFDAYWHTDLRSADETLEAAETNGLRLEEQERLNARAIGFWELSRAWIRARLAGDAPDRERLLRSLDAHARFQALYAGGDVDYLRLAFRKAG